MKKVIGITGSIGSGKSYAVQIFKTICKQNGINASFFDVDDIRRNILKNENVDRAELNKKIYNNQYEMKKYKDFINPKIKEYLIQKINNTEGVIFIEWALLIEDCLYDLVDNIIMIYCEEEIQIDRLKNGDLGKEEIIKINEEDPDEKMFLDFINRIETKNYDSCVSYVGEVIDSHVATFASEFANVSETVVDVESFFNDAVEMTKQIEKMMF